MAALVEVVVVTGEGSVKISGGRTVASLKLSRNREEINVNQKYFFCKVCTQTHRSRREVFLTNRSGVYAMCISQQLQTTLVKVVDLKVHVYLFLHNCDIQPGDDVYMNQAVEPTGGDIECFYCPLLQWFPRTLACDLLK